MLMGGHFADQDLLWARQLHPAAGRQAQLHPHTDHYRALQQMPARLLQLCAGSPQPQARGCLVQPVQEVTLLAQPSLRCRSAASDGPGHCCDHRPKGAGGPGPHGYLPLTQCHHRLPPKGVQGAPACLARQPPNWLPQAQGQPGLPAMVVQGAPARLPSLMWS